MASRRRPEETNRISPRKIIGYARQADQQLATKSIFKMGAHKLSRAAIERVPYFPPRPKICARQDARESIAIQQDKCLVTMRRASESKQPQNRAIDNLGISESRNVRPPNLSVLLFSYVSSATMSKLPRRNLLKICK